MSDSIASKTAERLVGGVCLVALAVLFVVRVNRLESFWLDEIFTAIVVAKPFDGILESVRADAHPPGYYALLRGWRQGLRALGVEPGIALLRAFNAPFVLLIGVGGWCLGRRFLGAWAGIGATVCLVFSAQVVYIAGDMRHYAVLTAATLACWLLMLELFRERTLAPRRRMLLWSGVWALETLVLWTHLLGGLFLGFLGLAWLVLVGLRHEQRGAFLREGAVAHAAALLAFAPWMPELMRNLAYAREVGTQWIADPTVADLLLALAYWPVFGRKTPSAADAWGELVIGAATLAIPLVLAAAAWRTRRPRPADPFLLVLAGTGILTTIAFVGFLWGVSRLGWMQLFEGRRYPVIALGPWLFGLTALGTWALDRLGRERPWILVVLAPWGLGAVAGNMETLVHREHGTLMASSRALNKDLVGRFERVYFTPEELLPLYRPFLPGVRLEPVGALVAMPEAEREAVILRVPAWEAHHAPDAWTWRSAWTRGVLAQGIDVSNVPPFVRVWPDYHVVHLFDARHANLRAAADTDPVRAFGDFPPGTIAVAAPERQRRADGWAPASIAPDGTTRRRTDRPEAVATFDAPIPPGSYRLHLAGINLPYPEPNEVLRLAFEGEEGSIELRPPNGRFETTVDVVIARPMATPRLRLARRLWRPADLVPGETDTRLQGFTVERLFVLPHEP
jgi:hypothetical protein